MIKSLPLQVPGQRSVALRLISAVLEKATVGFQNQQRIPTSFADLKGLVDWQAVWAYALGPEAELVLTLRSTSPPVFFPTSCCMDFLGYQMPSIIANDLSSLCRSLGSAL